MSYASSCSANVSNKRPLPHDTTCYRFNNDNCCLFIVTFVLRCCLRLRDTPYEQYQWLFLDSSDMHSWTLKLCHLMSHAHAGSCFNISILMSIGIGTDFHALLLTPFGPIEILQQIALLIDLTITIPPSSSSFLVLAFIVMGHLYSTRLVLPLTFASQHHYSTTCLSIAVRSIAPFNWATSAMTIERTANSSPSTMYSP